VPMVLVTSVLPIWRLLNMHGAFTSYQSFLEKGSTLRTENQIIIHWTLCTCSMVCIHTGNTVNYLAILPSNNKTDFVNNGPKEMFATMWLWALCENFIFSNLWHNY